MKVRNRKENHRPSRTRGFSLIELLVVVAIIVVIMAMAIPQALTMVHTFRLHNASTEFTSIVQQARMRSVKDSSFYKVLYINSTPITEAYVDIKGNGSLDTACTGTTDCDPVVSWNPEVTLQSKGTADSSGVDTAGLQTKVLVGSTSTGVTFLDGYDTSHPIIFSPMGIPCVANTAGTVCNTSSTAAAEGGGVVAYWMFLENTTSQKWEAVTVTPAGKIQKWGYSGSSWVQL